MDAFDIGRLTDFDFEAVCKDIFEDYLSVKLELFAPGRDRGIDLRCWAPEAGSGLVVQCKHWMNSSASTLISRLRKKELPKITALNPGRYILATSVRLSESDKAKIAATLAPYVVSTGDIFGLHEIESLLRARPKIVEDHMRLWLSSTGVLRAIVQKSILTRSSSFVTDAESAVQTYAPNPSYHQAEEILSRHHVCVIAGIPGVGKTTLAQVLAVAHAKENFLLYEISEDIEEVNTLWNDSENQFFYYDDFLGQTTLGDKLNKNEDARLLSVFRRVARSANKRLVLTTREYILEHARQQYEKIHRYDFQPSLCVLDIGQAYSKNVRAQILYNHIFFSGLPASEKAAFADPAIFGPILAHRNFNPRLVDASLRMCAMEELNGHAAARRIIESLDEPQDLWEHIVNEQLDDTCIHILTVLLSFSNSVVLEDLRCAYKAFCETVGVQVSDPTFRRSLKLLEQTMIKVRRVDGKVEVSFHNPSIADYMKIFLAESPWTLDNLLRSATFFEQVDYLCTIAADPREHFVRRHLKQLRAAVADALVRTHLSEGCTWTKTLFGLVKEDDATYRIARLVEISDQLGITELDDLVATFLQIHSAARLSRHEYVILRLIKAVWNSSLPQVRHEREELVSSLIEGLIVDIHDWHTAKKVQDFCDQLGDDIVSSDTYEVVQQALDLFVEQRLSEVASDHAERELNDVDEMEEMIAYAEGRHRTYFSNLQDAKRMVAKLGDDSEPLVPGQRSLFSSRSHAEKKIKKVDVAEMFLSLKKEVDE